MRDNGTLTPAERFLRIEKRIKELEENSVSKKSFFYGISIIVILQVVSLLLKLV